MDARTLSVDDAQELADLRRRAYGPDADIADDPAAVQRLRELEEYAVRADAAEGPEAGDRVSSAAASPPPSSADDRGAPVDGGAASEDAAGPEAPPQEPEPRRRWWRRVPVWSIVAVALVVGVAVGAGGISASTPRADIVLRPAPPEGGLDADWSRQLRTWGISPDSASSFEPYNGVVVWSAFSDEGSRCLVLESDGQPISATCVGGGFDPILDVTLYGGLDQSFDDPPPVGSVIRFIGRGDVVEVWVRERQSVEAASSETMPSSR